jgi:hypothetical protein
MVLLHYGFIRYYRLLRDDTEKYLEPYKNLERAGKDSVVIAFSLDENMKNIKPFLNSLLDQTVKVDDIAVTLHSRHKDKIPENLKKILNVHTYDKDYDDCGNLILSVLREPEAETKIIIIEPGYIYGEDFIQTIVEESDKNPEKIIKCKGVVCVRPKFFDEHLAEYKKGDGGSCLWLNKCSKAPTKDISYSMNYRY